MKKNRLKVLAVFAAGAAVGGLITGMARAGKKKETEKKISDGSDQEDEDFLNWWEQELEEDFVISHFQYMIDLHILNHHLLTNL